MTVRLVLLGGGHSHLFVLEGAARGGFPGVEITLVSAAVRQAYSGMVPGLIGGRYRPEEVGFDLAAIARTAGARFIHASATRILTAERAIELENGGRVEYDVLSVATGSSLVGLDVPGVRSRALTVKPIERACIIAPALARLLAEKDHADATVAVVGGGAAGVEVALAIRAASRAWPDGERRVRVQLVEAGPTVLSERPPAARRAAAAALARHRVTVRCAAEVRAVDADALHLADGSALHADVVVWATGPASTALLRDAGLATDAHGFLLVGEGLRSVSDQRVFAAGDAAALAAYPSTPKSGVYAVREGPILRDNLAAACRGAEPRRRFRPQRRALALLNTGDGRAILSYGSLAVTARWAMWLKDRIDRRFMRRFKQLEGGT